MSEVPPEADIRVTFAEIKEVTDHVRDLFTRKGWRALPVPVHWHGEMVELQRKILTELIGNLEDIVDDLWESEEIDITDA